MWMPICTWLMTGAQTFGSRQVGKPLPPLYAQRPRHSCSHARGIMTCIDMTLTPPGAAPGIQDPPHWVAHLTHTVVGPKCHLALRIDKQRQDASPVPSTWACVKQRDRHVVPLGKGDGHLHAPRQDAPPGLRCCDRYSISTTTNAIKLNHQHSSHGHVGMLAKHHNGCDAMGCAWPCTGCICQCPMRMG